MRPLRSRSARRSPPACATAGSSPSSGPRTCRRPSNRPQWPSLLTAFFLTDDDQPVEGSWEPTATLAAGLQRGDGRPSRGARRCPRRPGDGVGGRVHRRVPADDHPLRLGFDLDPSRPGSSLSFHDHIDRAGRSRSPRGTGHARPRRAAQRPDADEIKELLLQTAIYCGVPDANTAFRIARQALNEARAEQDQHQKEES